MVKMEQVKRKTYKNIVREIEESCKNWNKKDK